MEMAAMYYENRMTADWTYDIASLEHGRLPIVIDVITSPPVSSSGRGPIRAGAISHLGLRPPHAGPSSFAR